MTDSTQSETTTEVMQHFTVSAEQAARIREALEGCGEWWLVVRTGEDWGRESARDLLNSETHVEAGIDGFALGLLFVVPKFRALPAFQSFAGLSVTHLDVAGGRDAPSAVIDISGIDGFPNLTTLDLSFCKALTDLGPLASLSNLTTLNLNGCTSLTDLGPLASLSNLTTLNLGGWEALTDLRPLASLSNLTTLDLSSCKALTDLGPLASLPNLASLNLRYSKSLADLSPLASLSALMALDLSGCERLATVAKLAALPCLETLNLEGTHNIRDLHRLVDAPSLRELKFLRVALRDGVVLAIATRRRDPDLLDRITAMLESFDRSETPNLHATRVVAAIVALSETLPADTLSPLLTQSATAFRARAAQAATEDDTISAKTWERFFAACIGAPDPAFRPAFEAALDALPHSEAERVLAPALLALADAPEPAREWALALARSVLSGLPEGQARAIAPAAAVFFHAQKLPAEVDVWLERGSVKGIDAWRDRVFVALLGRALRLGDVVGARVVLAEVKTPERQDEGRALIAAALARREDFVGAAKELDAMVVEALRATAAEEVLTQTPRIAGDEHASLSLLLALDGQPARLAAVVASVVEQAPDSPLAAALAKAFAPLRSPGLSEAVDAVLADERVRRVSIPDDLEELRTRVAADPTLASRALTEATIGLLQREGVVSDKRIAALTAALLGGAS